MRNSFFFLMFILFISCNNKKNKLFKVLASDKTKIFFSNNLIENDSLNILNYEYFYNGAGIAIGDFNNDNLQDIFFTGNQVDNALYLNKGNLIFKNISFDAKINKPNSLIWSSGVNLIDINNDNLLDIYICNTLRNIDSLRRNLLYINQGLNNDSIPVFKEMSVEYNLADSSFSSNAQFFDYDNDGDLDLFIGVSQIKGMNPNVFRNINNDKNPISVDKLLENKWERELNHPVFEDVSQSAGIKFQGQTNSIIINDFNLDGWFDVFVANDFLSNDIVYLNNKNKTFRNVTGEVFKHSSLSSMGSDISDINNDGKLDLFVSEMQPFYNKRKKLFQRETSYTKEQITKKFNYQYQYFRNVLQLNVGFNKDNKLPVFSEIGMLSGVNQTDWSWSSLFGDFDNDGWNDLFIANGFPKDILDKDFSDFRNDKGKFMSNKALLKFIPEIKTQNFIFKNNKDLTFKDVSESWGMDYPSHSNGAAYGDLDNDGDLDLIINNINDEASILENISNEKFPKNNFVRIKLMSSDSIKSIYGTTATIYYNNLKQKQILISQRGYLSKSEDVFHFGIGHSKYIDSLEIVWPKGKNQMFYNIGINKVNYLKYDKSFKKIIPHSSNFKMFIDVSKNTEILYKDIDLDFDDFDSQRTLPRKFSQFGPPLAVGDLNGDKLEDLLIGGSSMSNEVIYYQLDNGKFKKKNINFKNNSDLIEEDISFFLFDIENDGDLDLYIVRGSSQFPFKSRYYKDALWVNNGEGEFSDSSSLLPIDNNNGSAVKGADFDNDGDIDLFVSSRLKPSNYPISDESILLENKSNIKNIKFEDSSNKILKNSPFGLINDFIWTDFNNDNLIDLIIASEWSSLRFFLNEDGLLKEVSETGVEDYIGWWNSITPSDIDNDGDLDYMLGNFGENTLFKANSKEPLSLIAKDFDFNNTLESFISFYLRDSLGVRNEYIYHVWEDVVKQYPYLRKFYNSHGKFGEATTKELFKNINLKGAITLKTNWLKSSWIENIGGNKFKLNALPIQAQFSPIYGIIKTDINGDEFDDFILVGNDFGLEPNQGRADAFNGLVLENTGEKKFKVLDLDQTNFLVSGDAKSLVKLTQKNNQILYIASQNNDSLKVYKINKNLLNYKVVNWREGEFKCKIYYFNQISKIIFRNDNQSFQSQSTENFKINDKVKSIDFFSNTDLLLRTLINKPDSL